MLAQLVAQNRSYRRFDETTPISMQTLEELVQLARLCPSAANRQPLRFILSTSAQDNAAIFDTLKWAAYLTDWNGPAEGERPTAYVIIVNTQKGWEFAKYDQGIMAQTMLLGAVEKGLGGCMIGAFDREKLAEHCGLSEEMEPCLILALGKPIETVRVTALPEDGSIRYYRDEAGVHYVPKRDMSELILQKKS